MVRIFVPAKVSGPPLVIARPLHRLLAINELPQPLFLGDNLSAGRIGLYVASIIVDTDGSEDEYCNLLSGIGRLNSSLMVVTHLSLRR